MILDLNLRLKSRTTKPELECEVSLTSQFSLGKKCYWPGKSIVFDNTEVGDQLVQIGSIWKRLCVRSIIVQLCASLINPGTDWPGGG